ncbi:MAG: hypothetical protein ACOX8E_06890 [Ruminococcus sp.]
MKSYEVIWEIFNQCANNQMRDVFFDEIETDNPEEYVKHKFKDKVLQYDITDHKDGTVIFDITTSGIKQRMTFTEI